LENKRHFEKLGSSTLPLVVVGKEKLEGFHEPMYKIAVTGFKDRQDGELNQTIVMYSNKRCSDCARATKFFCQPRAGISGS